MKTIIACRLIISNKHEKSNIYNRQIDPQVEKVECSCSDSIRILNLIDIFDMVA